MVDPMHDDHDHDQDHDHDHGSHLSDMELRVRALESILIEKGYSGAWTDARFCKNPGARRARS